MSCKACELAERDPRKDMLHKGCMSCEARALASIGAHVESAEAGAITPRFRAVLERLFGEDWKQGHELVRKWAKRIAEISAQERAQARSSKP